MTVTETEAVESGHGVGTAGGPGPETENEPGGYSSILATLVKPAESEFRSLRLSPVFDQLYYW